MPVWHKSLKDRFSTFPKYQQLLMIANELNRADNMRAVANEYKHALERALELMDFLSYDKRWTHQRRELRRAREWTAMLYADPHPQSTKLLQRCLIQLSGDAWKFSGIGPKLSAHK